jgi:DNA-binding NarL/FixJ family response regulator
VTSARSVRVILCDDHAIVRDGIARVLDAYDDIDVIGTAENGEAGVEATVRLRPDVVLMDLLMPIVDGVQATRRIVAAAPETAVVVLTSFGEQALVMEAIDAGASGFILKDAAPSELVGAIRSAARGEAPLDPRVARAVMSRRQENQPLQEMTAREREVLALVAAGLSNKLIARRLGITEATVKAHLTHIYRRIGVDSRVQAALWARQHGLDAS